jgi:hypothetical protein
MDLCCDEFLADMGGSRFVCLTCGRVSYETEYVYAEVEYRSTYGPSQTLRVNQYMLFIDRLQGTQSVKIPQEVYDAIDNEATLINKIPSELTKKEFNAILRKHNFVKYTLHQQKILNRFSRIEPMPEYLIEMLKQMLIRFDTVYNEMRPPNEKNFFRYAFFTYMVMLHLGYDGIYLDKCEDMLYLNKRKLADHQRTFKKIMDYL